MKATVMNETLSQLMVMTGRTGRYKISSGQTATGFIQCVYAKENDFIFGSGCEVDEGDAPDEGEIVEQGDFDFAPFTKIVCESGSAYLYGYNISVE